MALNAAFAQFGDAFAPRLSQRLNATLAREGVASPTELPEDLRNHLLKKAILETAAVDFAGSDVEGLRRQLNAWFHPEYGRALASIQEDARQELDAFAFAFGQSIGVFLAGLGLPVMPLDRKTLRPLAAPVDDVDSALSVFSARKTAAVGYATCMAPFYVLATDCLRTAGRYIASHPDFAPIRFMLKRDNIAAPDAYAAFTPGLMLFPRWQGDRFESVEIYSPLPDEGSAVFYAGWMDEDGESCGAPLGGNVPVFMQMVRMFAMRPASLACLRPSGARPSEH